MKPQAEEIQFMVGAFFFTIVALMLFVLVRDGIEFLIDKCSERKKEKQKNNRKSMGIHRK